MAQNLVIGGDCADAIMEIKDTTTANNWVLLGYVPKTSQLKVVSKGEGGLEEFTEELNDGKIQFGYLRFQIQQTSKFLYVSFCGGGVEGMQKGLFNNHAKDMENFLSQAGRGFHIQINARATDDLAESIVLDKLNKASTFLKTGSLKGADKGQLKEQSDQYWQQQKKKEVEHKEAISSHEKEKQDRLAASKNAEQQRLAEQAKTSLGELDQRRAQDAAAHHAREEERGVAQAKAREANTQKVLGDLEQRKQASYIPADAAHGVRQTAPNTASPAAKAAFTAKPAAPPPAAKKAPGKLQTTFGQAPPASNPPPAASKPVAKFAPKPVPAAAPKPAPPAVAPKPSPAKPAPSKPAPPPPRIPEPEPEPEPVYEEEQQEYYEEPTYEEPAYEEPAYEEPAYEEPAYEEPAYEEPAYEEPPAEEAAYEGAGFQARALYDYVAEAETDLSFGEGDTINILDDTDPSGWWKGELNGAEGFFPSNFVERI